MEPRTTFVLLAAVALIVPLASYLGAQEPARPLRVFIRDRKSVV